MAGKLHNKLYYYSMLTQTAPRGVQTTALNGGTESYANNNGTGGELVPLPKKNLPKYY